MTRLILITKAFFFVVIGPVVAQDILVQPPQSPTMVIGSAKIVSNALPIPKHENPCTIVHDFSPLFDSNTISPENGAFTQSILTPDINKDGYCDLFLTFFSMQYRPVPAKMYWYDRVSGHFRDESGRINNNEGLYFARESKVSDFNGDGLYDFVSISNPEAFGGSHPFSYVKLYLSAVDSTWAESTLYVSSDSVVDGDTTSGHYFHGISVGDLDGDGFVDLLVGNSGDNGKPDMVAYNNGAGSFSWFYAYGNDENYQGGYGQSLTLEIADFNEDGYDDIISFSLRGDHPTRILYGPFSSNLSQGSYQHLFDRIEGTNWTSNDYDFADIDYDGDRDLIITGLIEVTPEGPWPWEMRLLINDGLDEVGHVVWRDETELFTGYLESLGFYTAAPSAGWQPFIDLKDVNSDGYLDIIGQRLFTYRSDDNWILLGQGGLSDWIYPEYVGDSFGYWNEVLITGATDYGQYVNFVLHSRGDMPGLLTNSWIMGNKPAKITLYGSPAPFGDIAVVDLWQSDFDYFSEIDPDDYDECEGHPRCGVINISLQVPDSLQYFRTQVVNRYGVPSPLSRIYKLSTVNNASPFAALTASVLEGPAPLEIAFDASFSTDPNGDALTYAWDFGDGATGSGETVSHTYTAAGEYTVVLTASDGVLTGTDSLTVSIASGVDTESFELPETFVLKAAYPNPFNPTTTVTYGLPAASEIRITATDLLGRQVATLVAGDMMAAGYHTVQFNAEGLASGTYLIKMEAGDFVATQQVVLLK